MGVDMHPYCCYVHVVNLWYIIHQNHNMAWQLTWLDGLAVEHAYWKGEVLGSNLSWKSISLIRDFDLSAQEETDKTLISCFFHLTIFFAPCSSPQGPCICTRKRTRYRVRYWLRYRWLSYPDIGTPDTGTRYWHRYRDIMSPISGHLILYPILIPISGMWFTISVTWWPDIG